MSEGIVLSGVDGSNPLGFLAAVGLLRWLTEEDPEQDGVVTLHWRDEGVWRPVLGGVSDLEGAIQRIADDARSWLDAPALNLSYEKVDKKGVKVVYDLKPPPDVFRDWLRSLQGQARGQEFAAAYGVAEVTDNNGNVKPTALHFTAGQEVFLKAARELADGINVEHVRDALLGPWTYTNALKHLRWDASLNQNYALRATAPTAKAPPGVPGANWLAFLALPLFPVAGRGRRLETACAGGGWKDGRFRWPVWVVPAALPSVRALLTSSGLERLTAEQRRVRGIGQVFACSIVRADNGGRGTFSPARVATRQDRVGR